MCQAYETDRLSNSAHLTSSGSHLSSLVVPEETRCIDPVGGSVPASGTPDTEARWCPAYLQRWTMVLASDPAIEALDDLVEVIGPPLIVRIDLERLVLWRARQQSHAF